MDLSGLYGHMDGFDAWNVFVCILKVSKSCKHLYCLTMSCYVEVGTAVELYKPTLCQSSEWPLCYQGWDPPFRALPLTLGITVEHAGAVPFYGFSATMHGGNQCSTKLLKNMSTTLLGRRGPPETHCRKGTPLRPLGSDLLLRVRIEWVCCSKTKRLYFPRS